MLTIVIVHILYVFESFARTESWASKRESSYSESLSKAVLIAETALLCTADMLSNRIALSESGLSFVLPAQPGSSVSRMLQSEEGKEYGGGREHIEETRGDDI